VLNVLVVTTRLLRLDLRASVFTAQLFAAACLKIPCFTPVSKTCVILLSVVCEMTLIIVHYQNIAL